MLFSKHKHFLRSKNMHYITFTTFFFPNFAYDTVELY